MTLKGDVFTLFNPRSRYMHPIVREVFKPAVKEHGVPEEK
jgi:hypothetical protein